MWLGPITRWPTWPSGLWCRALALEQLYKGPTTTRASSCKGSYTHVVRWAEQIAQRPAVQRGRMVNRTWGELSEQLHERHDASDFELRTKTSCNPRGDQP